MIIELKEIQGEDIDDCIKRMIYTAHELDCTVHYVLNDTLLEAKANTNVQVLRRQFIAAGKVPA